MCSHKMRFILNQLLIKMVEVVRCRLLHQKRNCQTKRIHLISGKNKIKIFIQHRINRYRDSNNYSHITKMDKYITIINKITNIKVIIQRNR
jgi:hypothetical protein